MLSFHFFLTPTLKTIDLALKSDFSKLVSTYKSEQMTLVFVTHKFPVPSSCLLLVQMYVYGFMVYTQTQILRHTHTHAHACPHPPCTPTYVMYVFVVCGFMDRGLISQSDLIHLHHN